MEGIKNNIRSLENIRLRQSKALDLLQQELKEAQRLRNRLEITFIGLVGLILILIFI
jgi:hypothetical protein